MDYYKAIYKDIKNIYKTNKKQFKKDFIQFILYSKYEYGSILRYIISSGDFDFSYVMKIEPEKSYISKFKHNLYFGLILINDEHIYRKIAIKNKLVLVKFLEYCLLNYESIIDSFITYRNDIERVLSKNSYIIDYFKFLIDDNIDNVNIMKDINIYENFVPIQETKFYYNPNVVGKLLVFLYKCKMQSVRDEYLVLESDDVLYIKEIKPLYHEDYKIETDSPELEGYRWNIIKYIRYKDLSVKQLSKKIDIFTNIEIIKEAETFYERFISHVYEYVKNSMVNYQLLEWFFIFGFFYNKLEDSVKNDIFKLLFLYESSGLKSDLLMNDNMTDILKNSPGYDLGSGEDSIFHFLDSLKSSELNELFSKKFIIYGKVFLNLDKNCIFNSMITSDKLFGIITKFSPKTDSVDRIISEIVSNVTIDINLKNYNTYLLLNSENNNFEYLSNDTKLSMNKNNIDERSINLFNKGYIKFSIYEILNKFSIIPKTNVIIEKNNVFRNILDISNILFSTEDTCLDDYKKVISENLNCKNKSIVSMFASKYGY